MLKKLVLTLLLTFSLNLFAQEEKEEIFDIDSRQKEVFLNAETALKDQELNRAYAFFSLAQNFGSNKEIKDLSLKKSDSLKVILRTNLTKEITGNWKLITAESWAMREPSDSVVAKMITINPDQILFYELYPKTKKWSLIKTEKLVFTDKPNMSSDPLYISYSNKDVWSYYIDKTSGGLIAYFIGQEHNTGISEIICGNTKIEYFKLQ
ncbi:hypothetical protein [Flavobacterium sp. FlaQc-30]|uniref:hypothetical protein n=1 Tax=Flavobacterium sp. FlaQc-30 TaxID=3374179 RepID=UPI003756B896